MDAAAVPIMSSSLQVISRLKHPSNPAFITNHQSLSSINKPPILLNRNIPSSTSRRPTAAYAISAIASDTNSAQAEITWQIAAGALAGVTPFVVAGIEFSKRILAQRKCVVCKGTGLVLRDKKYYFRCPGCGGFLPWQSWRRFFTG